MFSFEPELQRLRPLLGNANTDALLARERREVFSIHPELRICGWIGAMLLAIAAGILLKDNFERIGPLALSLLIAIAAIACYAFVWWRRDRAGVVDDYVLLLGALLLSADIAFIESQYHFFGKAWSRHFLIVGVVHGVTAYLYRSRTLLSLAIAAAASWLGVNAQQALDFYPHRSAAPQYALRATAACALVLAWRRANRIADFTSTFDHFAAVFALIAGFALMVEDTSAAWLVVAIGAAIIWWGFRVRRESLVLLGFVAIVLALDIHVADLLDGTVATLFAMLVSTIVAIVLLMRIHARFAEGSR